MNISILSQDKKSIVMPRAISITKYLISPSKNGNEAVFVYKVYGYVGGFGEGASRDNGERELGAYDSDAQAKQIIERMFFEMCMGNKTYEMPANNFTINEEE